MSLCHDFNSEVGAVIRAESVAEHLKYNSMRSPEHEINRKIYTALQPLHLKLLRVVHARDGLHQVRSGMVAEIRADVTHTQTSRTGLQVLWMLIGRFVKSIDL